MIIIPILQKERLRHKGLMTCRDHTTSKRQNQNSHRSSLTLGPVPRTHEMAEPGLGVEEAGLGWGCQWRGGEGCGISTIKRL